MNIKTLVGLASKLEAGRAEIVRMAEEETALEGQIKTILSELQGLSVEEVLRSPPEGPGPRSKTAEKFQMLAMMRQQLELLPAIKGRLQTTLQSHAQNISIGARKLLNELRDVADLRVEAFRSKLNSDMLAHCGGDADRAKAAADAVVRQSEAWQWFDHFAHYYRATDPIEFVQGLAADIAAFEADKPLRSVGEEIPARAPVKSA